MPFVKPRPIPLIMSVSAVFIMFGLGIWQLQRLVWKEELIATIEAAQAEEPIASNLALADATAHHFYNVMLEGEYLPQRFDLAARYYKSQLGYHIFSPFLLTSGERVLINRGWIPAGQKEADYPLPEGRQNVIGQLRLGNDRNAFTPANDTTRNIWFGRDAIAMCESANLTCSDVTFDLVSEQQDGVYPIPARGEINLRNDHLGYALTWFGIGLGALVITLIYHYRKPGDRAETSP